MFVGSLLLVFIVSSLVSSDYQEFSVSSICQTYRGMIGDMAAAAVHIGDKPAIIRLSPAGVGSLVTCEIDVSVNHGFGVALHVQDINLAVDKSEVCEEWIQIESQSLMSHWGGLWGKIRSFSQKICGNFSWNPLDPTSSPMSHFYNETTTNRIKIWYHPQKHQQDNSFTLVVTPISRYCRKNQFLCGGHGAYCVSSNLSCDGKVNCMMPGKEGYDESREFCKQDVAIVEEESKKIVDKQTKNGTGIIKNDIVPIEDVIPWPTIGIAVTLPILVITSTLSICRLVNWYKRKKLFFDKLGQDMDGKLDHHPSSLSMSGTHLQNDIQSNISWIMPQSRTTSRNNSTRANWSSRNNSIYSNITSNSNFTSSSINNTNNFPNNSSIDTSNSSSNSWMNRSSRNNSTCSNFTNSSRSSNEKKSTQTDTESNDSRKTIENQESFKTMACLPKANVMARIDQTKEILNRSNSPIARRNFLRNKHIETTKEEILHLDQYQLDYIDMEKQYNAKHNYENVIGGKPFIDHNSTGEYVLSDSLLQLHSNVSPMELESVADFLEPTLNYKIQRIMSINSTNNDLEPEADGKDLEFSPTGSEPSEYHPEPKSNKWKNSSSKKLPPSQNPTLYYINSTNTFIDHTENVEEPKFISINPKTNSTLLKPFSSESTSKYPKIVCTDSSFVSLNDTEIAPSQSTNLYISLSSIKSEMRKNRI